MNLFTKIDIPATDARIDYKSRLTFFGSCFADNISAQFASRKFKVLANPFGTVYNPLSTAMQIKAIANGKIFGERDVFQDAQGLWYSWDAHGSLFGKSREECIAKLNAATSETREFLQNTDVVFVTLGTAFVYFLRESGIAVSNCHRQNPNLFIRKMISVEHATEALKSIVRDLQKIKRDAVLRLQASPSAQDDKSSERHENNQVHENCENRDLHIVFTVSPLRHMSDGAHSNTLSKATLQLAVEKLMTEYDRFAEGTIANPAPFISYFPSYEIAMDELRDYRFYDSDMIHLSKIAEEYIFERMAETYCNENTRENIKQVEKFLKSANHRIQDAGSPATAAFLQKLHAEATKLERQIEGLKL